MKIRKFEDRDLSAYVSIGNRSYPDYGWTEEDARHEDSTWTDPKYFRARFVLEDDGGAVVGAVDLHHQRGWFDPARMRCDLTVDPDHRRRGYGSALFDQALKTARSQHVTLLVASAKESMTDGVDFLRKHEFVERQRSWESRLDVAAFDLSKFADAEPRVAKQGIRITTLADEMKKDRDAAIRKAYEIEDVCRRDIPSVDRPTEGSFERFLMDIEGPQILLDAFFLAAKDGEYVGLSDLWKDSDNPQGLYQGLTGVDAEHRGKGIAMALKLQTVKYARATGRTLIKTWNDTRNRPMLRINEAMGFVKQPVWIEFGKQI
jgi:GNAT superfamily N-acetyltransferase